jgi:hypothetical protein
MSMLNRGAEHTLHSVIGGHTFTKPAPALRVQVC